MSESNEPLKVGRIPIAVERALNLHLASNVSVYMSEERISTLASEKPKGYLTIIEETSSILHNPDFVCYNKEAEQFLFVKSYVTAKGFRFVGLGVTHVGVPKRWNFDHMRVYRLEELNDINKTSAFARP